MRKIIYFTIGSFLGLVLSVMVGYSASSSVKNKVVLTPKNTVVIRGEINEGSVSVASNELLSLSNTLKPEEVIYLVIDSGGGSVLAGVDLIAVMETIKNPIHTISIYSYSMAYSISQRGTARLITPYGITGQHRAAGTFKGQFAEGEVESRLKFFSSYINALEKYEAERMGVSLKRFKALVKDESYFFGQSAVTNKVADGVVSIECSKELIAQQYTITPEGSFFRQRLSGDTYSACPLLRTPIITR